MKIAIVGLGSASFLAKSAWFNTKQSFGKGQLVVAAPFILSLNRWQGRQYGCDGASQQGGAGQDCWQAGSWGRSPHGKRANSMFISARRAPLQLFCSGFRITIP
jgi:hypothetical protein